MPVKHDLYQDLGKTKADVDGRRATDAKLDRLVQSYDDIDAQILDAESSSGTLSDDKLAKLKEERLLAKDKIVQRLDYPDSNSRA